MQIMRAKYLHDDSAATDAEIVAMGELLAEGMAAGALGFSTGLFYPTNSGAPNTPTSL